MFVTAMQIKGLASNIKSVTGELCVTVLGAKTSETSVSRMQIMMQVSSAQ
jgi:hypothetical protein